MRPSRRAGPPLRQEYVAPTHSPWSIGLFPVSTDNIAEQIEYVSVISAGKADRRFGLALPRYSELD
jgi:hypothetical protein